jgi:uncharacterized membrane protein
MAAYTALATLALPSLWLDPFGPLLKNCAVLGTGLGTAFHGWMAQRSHDLRAITVVSRDVVLADWLFTTPAVVVQPVTGVWMAGQAGYPMTTGWLAAALVLYVIVGACWLPVVWLQVKMHRLAASAEQAKSALPSAYFLYARIWFLLGWPACFGVIAIFFLMVFKPPFGPA